LARLQACHNASLKLKRKLKAEPEPEPEPLTGGVLGSDRTLAVGSFPKKLGPVLMVDALKLEEFMTMSAMQLDCDAFEQLPLFEDTDGTSSDVDSVLDAVGMLPPSDVWMQDMDWDTPDGLAGVDDLPDDWTHRRADTPRVVKPARVGVKPKAKKAVKIARSLSGDDSPPPLRMRTYTARKVRSDRCGYSFGS
jgi:hypothetical protein